jgi:histidine ammonia-lyase
MGGFAVSTISTATSIEPAVETVIIDGSQLTLEDVARVARADIPAFLSVEPTVQARIVDGFRRLNELIDSGNPVYG